jgi:cytosine/adenosine deaminase-related metal-dependent hydrolase
VAVARARRALGRRRRHGGGVGAHALADHGGDARDVVDAAAAVRERAVVHKLPSRYDNDDDTTRGDDADAVTSEYPESPRARASHAIAFTVHRVRAKGTSHTPRQRHQDILRAIARARASCAQRGRLTHRALSLPRPRTRAHFGRERISVVVGPEVEREVVVVEPDLEPPPRVALARGRTVVAVELAGRTSRSA